MAQKPITKYPKNSITTWPPVGGTLFEASPFDSWWTAANACGRDNVWDVIYFNFQTTDGAEVNYYMAKLLGCTKLSKNKRDYSFGRKDGKPVQVYLPGPSWKLDPRVHVPPKPVRPAMSIGDVAAAQLVLGVLGSPPLGWMNFEIGPYRIDTFEFRKVADRIRSGTFSVYRLPEDSKAAHYDPVANALFIRLGWDLTERAKIVHEAVHAIFDLKKATNIPTLDDEAAAYLAESIYAQVVARPNPQRQLLGKGAEANAIFLAAYQLAMRVIGGDTLCYADFQPLRDVIAVHPDYASGASDVAGYDGVYEMAPV